MGLAIANEFDNVAVCARVGVLALPAGLNVLRLLPPLVIEKSDLDTVAEAIEAVLR